MSGYERVRSAQSSYKALLGASPHQASVDKILANTARQPRDAIRGRARPPDALVGTAQPSHSREARLIQKCPPSALKTPDILNLCLQVLTRAPISRAPHTHTCARAPPQLRRPHQIRSTDDAPPPPSLAPTQVKHKL